MQPSKMVPNNLQTLATLRQIAQAPWNEKPSIEMTEETSRDIQIIWSSIQACRLHWRGEYDLRIPDQPLDRDVLWSHFAQKREPECLPIVNEFLTQNSGQGKLAIELG